MSGLKKHHYFFLPLLFAASATQAMNVFHTVTTDWAMWPILALSVIAVGLCLERLVVVFLERRRLRPALAFKSFQESLEKNGGDKLKTIDEIGEICKQRRGICATLLLAVFRKYKVGSKNKMNPSELRAWMMDAVESEANVELPTLDAHLTGLAVIANVATLCGLFGTVVGMIKSFTAMANSPGGVKADEMAGGIATALIATAGGLLVAVPSLVIYNLIKGHIENYVVDVEEACVRIIDTLAE
ncbi:MAG: MotA/TolQ/ExbB proton channel family protein [Fibrobacterota bacterium]